MTEAPERACLRELVRRVAAHPRGLAFLHLGDLESVAITLMVHPFIVAEARALLETPEGRAYLIEEVRRARVDFEHAPSPEPGLSPRPPRPAPPRTPAELIRAARGHSLGSSFLLDGYPEAVAVTFQVHPDLVFRARDILERWERMKASRPRRTRRRPAGDRQGANPVRRNEWK